MFQLSVLDKPDCLLRNLLS